MALDQSLLTYGVELAGSWVNMMLYMLELVMCLRYFQRCSRPLPHRIGVGALVLFDTLCTITVNANVFMTFLCLLGKKALTSLSIPTSVMIFLTYLTATCEQLFLCQLYFILTRNRLISLFLAFLAVLHFSFSFAAGIMVQTTPFAEFPTTSFIELPTFTITAVGAILCAVTDLLIAGCLGYEFFKIKTNAASTKSLFGRIYILSIASGAIVASNTLIMMILFLNYNIVFEFFFFCQGRVYALTLLVNFLSGPSSSATSPSHDTPQSSVVFCEHTHPSVFSGMGGTRPPPSIYSHYSDDSLRKELSPLPKVVGFPTTSSQKTVPWPRSAAMPVQISSHSAQAASVSSHSSFGTVSSPQTPRTVILPVCRVDSLPQNA